MSRGPTLPYAYSFRAISHSSIAQRHPAAVLILTNPHDNFDSLRTAEKARSVLGTGLAVGAHTVENDLVMLDGEAVRIGNLRYDIVLIGHVDVEHAAAYAALRM